MSSASRPLARVADLLAEFSDRGACIAELLCDRHPPAAVAFTIVEADRSVRELTYGDLREASQRFAVALAGLGVGPGDCVATLMGKSADLVVAMLGIWRRGAVQVPLFTAFAPPAIKYRMEQSDAAVIVTDADHQAKLGLFRDDYTVIVAGEASSDSHLHMASLIAEADPLDARATPFRAGGDAEFCRLFTSGTTGNPKGVAIPVRAVASFLTYFEFGLGVEADDVYWDAADPGWGYGLFYGIIAPLAAGKPNILLHAGFSAELTYWVLETLRVTNFAAAPTVYRVLRSSGVPAPAGLALRRCSAAGEPLNPEVVAWAERTLGVPVRDHYGQTEHGMVIVNGWHPDIARPLRDGSMGHPMPGWHAEIFLPDRDSPAPPGIVGRVVIDVQRSPLMWFTHYVDAPEKTAERFSPDGRWFYTGDAASVDADGYVVFSARDDDIILMAGYRIGPVEVENVLLTHPDVAEAAVLGVPDPLLGEALEAFVVLRPGRRGSAALVGDLQQLVKRDFAAHAYPRAVHFEVTLPMTPSGKVQRTVLRERRRQEMSARR